MTRLTLLTEIPAPYRVPLFNALADRLDLHVVFLRERNPQRPYGLHRDEWRFRATTLPGRDWTVAGRWVVVNRGTRRSLRGTDAVLVGGWNQPAFWQALAEARRRRLPAGVWIESTQHDTRLRLAAPAKRALLRAFDVVVVPGQSSREHVLSLGVEPQRVVLAPNAVDNDFFAGGTRSRAADSRCRVLCVGRLAHEKGVDVLLEAVRNLEVDLALAGTGPAEQELRVHAPPRTQFLGHVARDDLPQLYADADVLVVPSRVEPWGMVVNEGAAAGLPIVVSDAVAAGRELVEDGGNGFVVRAGEAAALREALVRLRDDEPLRRRLGDRSRDRAAELTPERWAEAVATAFRR